MAVATNLMSVPPNGLQPGAGGQNGGHANGRSGQGNNGLNGPGKMDVSSPSDSDVDEARSREIATKAVTGILILLLKWFKLSRTQDPDPDPPPSPLPPDTRANSSGCRHSQV